MELCKDGHSPVVFVDGECPACELALCKGYLGSVKKIAAEQILEIAKLNGYIDILCNSPMPSEVQEIEKETGRRPK